MIVIDTHALVWFINGDRRLGKEAVRIVEEARANGGVLISPIMTWEVGMLVDKDRLALGIPADQWFERVLGTAGFGLAPFDATIGLDAGMLPGGIHGDPADRLMIATARFMRTDLLTADEQILRYAQAGHVRAIDARI